MPIFGKFAKYCMVRAFVFTLESILSLLIAIALLSSLQYLKLPTYSDVYLLQLTNDFQQISAKAYYSEFAAFSKGDFFAKNKIKTDFSKLIDGLGNYCLIIEARFEKIEINCELDHSKYKKRFPTNRLFFDGTDFFELKISLMQ